MDVLCIIINSNFLIIFKLHNHNQVADGCVNQYMDVYTGWVPWSASIHLNYPDPDWDYNEL